MKQISMFRQARLAAKRVLHMRALKRHRMEAYTCIQDAPPYGVDVEAMADEAFFDIWSANVLAAIDRNLAVARHWAESNPMVVHGDMSDWEILTHDPHYILAIFQKNRELRDQLDLYTQIHLDAIAVRAKERRPARRFLGSGSIA